MPSIFSHAVAGLCLGACFVRPSTPRAVLAVGAACAVVPDLDVAGWSIGIGLDQPLGHRGLSHSIVFAAALATACAWGIVRRWHLTGEGLRIWLYLFTATTSHGILDAMTNGGHGVGFFVPFSDQRYHFPFRPIEVSPLGVTAFFSRRGLEIMANELVWVWAPSLLMAALVIWWRQRASGERASWSSS